MKKLILTLMKTNKIFTLFTIIAMSFAITSCVQDDDYTVPSSLGDEENALLNDLLSGNAIEVTIAQVKAMYLVEFDPGDNAAVLIDEDIYVKGYVSSSDQTGNFFKEFYIQDSPSNPTGALKIAIDQVDTYNQFNIGREVYVNLNGLYIGEQRIEDGVITIGGDTETDQYGTTVVRLNTIQKSRKVLRSKTTEVMEPLVTTFSQLTDSSVGLLVSVENAEFADDLAGLNYFDPIQSFDTQRRLQTCEGASYTTFNLETSSFANFKNTPLPLGNGTITAVVNKTFDGASVILALNSIDNVNFTEARCEVIDISDYVVVYEEDFVGGLNGWEVNTTEGTMDWYPASFGGVSYIRGSAYDGSNAVQMVSWLISPSFDFDAQTDEQMILEIADAFSDAGEEPLTAYYSNDYVSGNDPSTATWTEVGASQIEALPINGGFFDNVYDATNFIDLSAATGNGVIAFVYDSDDAAISSTRDLGNVKILSPQ
ncbi:DUF5689 domain-containing protein [Psychroserpens ponticola]|uniref:DUF5689 domain-containing protein n=1 Tax=Psychroserpens ponticola TaxID=2932268 RepID=A0ABY7RXE4_9FLAO|nr:DUF5689 domain-containing protein [Psychroserpens ponticola]WCO01528.1 DUF5689 domain-containing protein [Psychroserpens ponticola]